MKARFICEIDLVNHNNKSITYVEDHIFSHVKTRLEKTIMLPNEVNFFKHLFLDLTTFSTHRNLIYQEGYRVYLFYKNKRYLLIYNK
jgi:hypothetical protein